MIDTVIVINIIIKRLINQLVFSKKIESWLIVKNICNIVPDIPNALCIHNAIVNKCSQYNFLMYDAFFSFLCMCM